MPTGVLVRMMGRALLSGWVGPGVASAEGMVVRLAADEPPAGGRDENLNAAGCW